MALTSQQQQVLRAFNKAARDTKASPKTRKALIEAGLVESHLQNLNYGDRDSKGALQQRSSQGWMHATDPYLAAVDFIKHAQPIAKKYGTAGQLAQAVQRSAFPARYDQVSGQASSLLGQVSGGRVGSLGSSSTSLGSYAAPNNAASGNAQLALSLLGVTNSYDSTDPLTAVLQTALQKPSSAPPVPSGPQPTPADLHAIVNRAKQIDSEHLPYQWGGGHGAKPAGPGVPLDCSGAVSRLLGVSPRVSGNFTKYGSAGKGKALTIYANGTHVLLEIKGHFWGTSASNPGGGAGWIPRGQISSQYLKNFVARHPGGM